MGRPKTDIRISIKGRDGKTHRINLVELLDGRFAYWRNGKRRGFITATEFGKRMTQWLSSQKRW